MGVGVMSSDLGPRALEVMREAVQRFVPMAEKRTGVSWRVKSWMEGGDPRVQLVTDAPDAELPPDLREEIGAAAKAAISSLVQKEAAAAVQRGFSRGGRR